LREKGHWRVGQGRGGRVKRAPARERVKWRRKDKGGRTPATSGFGWPRLFSYPLRSLGLYSWAIGAREEARAGSS